MGDQACPSGILLRRAAHELSPAEWTRFTGAVRLLQQERSGGTGGTRYDALVKCHIDSSAHVQGWAPYLPWYRYYLRQYEIGIQSFDSGLAIPYWDWSLDSQEPERSAIWKYMGGNGANLPGRPVTDGPFATWTPEYSRPHRLSREWNQGSRISAFPGAETVNSTIRSSSSHNKLRQALESWSAHVQVGIGGDMTRRRHSPNDPVYLLHLAYQDKLWSDWQQLSPANATAYGGTNSDGTSARSTDRLPGFVATVGDTFNTSNLCYRY